MDIYEEFCKVFLLELTLLVFSAAYRCHRPESIRKKEKNWN